ncbi:hypothetical protein D3C80_1804230 [compost metagenome]
MTIIYMPKILPRDSLVARSFNQLSMTMKAPAIEKPVKARRITQIVASTKMPESRAITAADAAKQPNART